MQAERLRVTACQIIWIQLKPCLASGERGPKKAHDGDGKTDAGTGAGCAVDCCVDSYDIPLRVQQWPAAIA